MQRIFAAKILATFLKALDHPDRIRIIEEIGSKELNVSSLQHRLKLAQPVVSRHLAALRLADIVLERREGRSVFYGLRVPRLSQWLIHGIDLVSESSSSDIKRQKALTTARKLWVGTSGAKA